MIEIQPVREGAAYHKAHLIQQALEKLRASNQVDERDDLTAASFLEWYDRTIPDVRDIKLLAGAMEIELARRRGEKILQEEERRGGNSKVSGADTLLSNATKVQRSKERAIAAAPEAVTAFIAREKAAGRVPTVRAAAGVARTARMNAQLPIRHQKQIEGAERRNRELDERILAALVTIADGKRRSEAELTKITGWRDVMAGFIERIRLIPWVQFDRMSDGFRFSIDEQLRAICEGRRPRPTLSYTSLDTFLREVRTELTRRRKENHDEREKRRWNSELILKREQSKLLDWIEDQLDRVPPV